MPRRAKSLPPLQVNTNRDCYLFSFSETAPLAAATLLLFESLLDHRKARKKGDEWIIFSGSGEHWCGLNAWLLVTDNIPLGARDLFLERVNALGYFGNYEAIDIGRPSRNQQLKPVLRLSDDGDELLVQRGDALALKLAKDSLPVRVCIPVTR